MALRSAHAAGFQARSVRQPGGKVKKEVAVAIMDMRQMARSFTAEALDKLVQLMRGEVKVGDKVHPVPVHTQGWAAAELIDRG
jgi:hypothetical protein